MELDDETSFLNEGITDVVPESGGVDLHLVPAGSRHWILVALAAPRGIEEGTKPGFGRERTVECGTASGEAVQLFGSQPSYRVAGLERFLARHRAPEEDDRDQ